MRRKLLGTVNVDFDADTDHIFCICQILEKKMGIQQSNASALYRLQESL